MNVFFPLSALLNVTMAKYLDVTELMLEVKSDPEVSAIKKVLKEDLDCKLGWSLI